ncbi:hypothetical protein WG66_016331 [Moniliophthora roreri]|nr:hypothetical protein WG66_016331 [Moniliophthora roreri]
MKKLRRSQY